MTVKTTKEGNETKNMKATFQSSKKGSLSVSVCTLSGRGLRMAAKSKGPYVIRAAAR